MQINKIIEERDRYYAQMDEKQATLYRETEETKKALEKSKEEAKNLSIELEKSKNIQGIKDTIKGVEKGLKRSIEKAKTLILGIFGIRGAYMAVRSALNIISSDDQQMKADIDYIRNVLAYALEPIVRTIVDWVKTLVSYVGYLAKAWFNYDIFAKATEKSLKSSVGSAKELRKQLASFDEMNVLQDQSSSGGGGGGVLPDFGSFELDNQPKWLEWIASNGDFVKTILEAIASAILAIKYGLGLIEGLGIFLILDGVVNLIRDIKVFLEDPTWSNFRNVVFDIAEIILGLGLLTGNPLLMVLGGILEVIVWLMDYLGSIVQLISDPSWDNYYGVIWNLFDLFGSWGATLKTVLGYLGLAPKNIKDTKDAEDDLLGTQIDLNDAQEEYWRMQDDFTRAIDNADKAFQRLKDAEDKVEQSQDGVKISGKELYMEVMTMKRKYEDLSPELKEVYNAYINNEQAQYKARQEQEKMNATLQVVNSQIRGFGQTVDKSFSEASKNANEGSKSIGKSITEIGTTVDEQFGNNIPNKINNSFNADRYTGQLWGLVGTINNILSYVKPINVQMNLSSNGGGHGFAKGGVVVPRLASGGIINQPGRGVPISSAIGGESGMEGVIPLTDSQQMELLGSAIGRYITINANITNTMNGKVISRELQRVQNDEDFAFNR